MNKENLRELIKQKRISMVKTGEIMDISDKITSNIKSSDLYKNSFNIGFYYPLKIEIDILGIYSKDKNFYLPRCVDDDVEFAKFDGNLKSGPYRIPEPVCEKIDPDIMDVIYIPCLCANKRNYRLGWGKGCYDRFFKLNNTSAKKIIVCPRSLITDEFTEDEFDFRCDDIITD